MKFIGWLLGMGVRVVFKNKIIRIVIIGVCVGLMGFGIGKGEFLTSVLLILIFLLPIIFLVGIVECIRTIPHRKRERYFAQVFQDMKFCATNGQVPIYIEEMNNNVVTILRFYSQIPLEIWTAKKRLLETHLNTKIVKIENPANNFNLVAVHTANMALPNMMPWRDSFLQPETDVLSAGIDYEGITTIDLNQSPHCFVAGETGSGKSNLLKCLIYQCLKKGHDVKLIDFKRGVSFLEFSSYLTIYSEYQDILYVLEELTKETLRRLDLLVSNRAENMIVYNKTAPVSARLKRIVVFIDELAELMRAGDKETNKQIVNCIETLTRVSRAAGINLIMGLQRPDSTVITGQIKSNVSLRICGRFVDPEPSRIMLGNNKAMDIPDIKGRFIFKSNEYVEFQAFYITRAEMELSQYSGMLAGGTGNITHMSDDNFVLPVIELMIQEIQQLHEEIRQLTHVIQSTLGNNQNAPKPSLPVIDTDIRRTHQTPPSNHTARQPNKKRVPNSKPSDTGQNGAVSNRANFNFDDIKF